MSFNLDKSHIVSDTFSASFHDSHYSLSILLFAISIQPFFHSGKPIAIASAPDPVRTRLGDCCIDKFIFIVPKATGTRAIVFMMMMILLLQAIAAIQTSLLIRSGNVETNPGPGRYGG